MTSFKATTALPSVQVPRPFISHPHKHAIAVNSFKRANISPKQRHSVPSRPIDVRSFPKLQAEDIYEPLPAAAVLPIPPPSSSHSAATPPQPPPTAAPSADSIVTCFRWPAHLPGRAVAITGSFNNWGTPLPLTRVPGRDWIRSIALPPGPIEFKYVVDGKFACSPCEPAARRGEIGPTNNHRLVQSTCEFVWPSKLLHNNTRGDGKGTTSSTTTTTSVSSREIGKAQAEQQVMVAGDWSGWGELLPLSFDPVTDVHSLRCSLPPGTYAYQFLVNDEWRLRPDVDAAHTIDGHFANIVKVTLPQTFRIFYSTGWTGEVSLKVRGLDAEGVPLTDDWTEVEMHNTASRSHLDSTGRQWKAAKVAACGVNAPAALEFIPVAADGSEDRAPGGGAYLCPRPGGYKLRSGHVRPFTRASFPRVMLVSDLDGTLVGEGPEADAKTADFGRYWEDSAALVGSVLVYNTGRSQGQFEGLLKDKNGALPLPDALITAVGTKIFLLNREGGTRGTASGLEWHEDLQWSTVLDENWDLKVAREAGAAAVAAAPEGSAHWLDDGSEHPHRIALSVHADAVPGVKAILQSRSKSAGVACQLIVSGAGEWRYVDMVSAQGGKLNALEYVRSLFGIPTERCIAAGDSGNDSLMLGGRNPAIVVGNAQDELLEWVMRQSQEDGRLVVSDAEMAHGVLEGLGRLGMY